MRSHDLHRAIARATGETVTTISQMGFVPLWPRSKPRSPRFLDWDELERQRQGGRPHPSDS